MKFPSEGPSCKRIEVLKPCAEKYFQELIHTDPLEKCLSESLSEVDLDKETPTCVDGVIETILALENKDDETVIEEEVKTSDGLVLKQLPEHLRYSFLGDDETKPVIISSDLTKEEELKLLEVLRQHQSAFAWSISDIKGISPSICMHKILMEDDYKPTIEHQRRLNPAMKEIVKKKVLKWLNAGFIYAISDSSWVSPAQVVPKKGGMTVVKNEKNELIPTRTVTGWRICIDYRKLNKATRKDHFPLPFIDQMLDRLAGH